MTLHAHSAGMVRRMGRLFSGENDTAIIVAMDHGMAAVPEGLERIRLDSGRRVGRLRPVQVPATRPDGQAQFWTPSGHSVRHRHPGPGLTKPCTRRRR